MKLRKKNPALLLVDVQKGFQDEAYWGGNRNNKGAEIICGKILNTWRALDLPVFHVRHSSINPESRLHKTHKGFEFDENVLPEAGEPVITKNVNSAFIGTNLKELLDEQNIHTLIIAGLTTNHCVSTTTRMAGNYGFETYLIADATATFDRMGMHGERFDSETVHQISLASLSGEFATIRTFDKLMEEIS